MTPPDNALEGREQSPDSDAAGREPGRAAGGGTRAGDSARGTAPKIVNTAEQWRAVRRTAKEDPLAHPLAFSMGALSFEYPTPPHLVELYGALHDAVTAPEGSGTPKQLVRLMPRDHGKSEAGSVVFPTWAALSNPDIRILIMMHKEGKAAGKLSQCREHIEDLAPRFGRRVAKSNNRELKMERDATHDVPTIEAAGFESGVTGGHYDAIIFDDAVTWDTQNTDGKRAKVLTKFKNYMNLGDEAETTYLVLGTRKHRDDLYSWLMDNSAWDDKVYRALGDRSVIENGEFTLVTDTGANYPAEQRNAIPAGETLVDVKPHRGASVLWPDRYSLSDLIFEYLSAGDTGHGGGESGDESGGVGSSAEWVREKLNEPSALTGELLAEDMITFEQSLPAGTRPRDLVNFVSLDLGIEKDPQKAASNDTDYWALAVLSYAPDADTAYLRDITRRRGMTGQQAVEWVQRQLRPYDYGTVHVESVQGQEFFTQALSNEGVPVTRVTPSRGKEERIVSMSTHFESGFVRVYGSPDDATWDSYTEEWVGYPSGRHDDRLDATAISISALLDWKTSKKNKFHFG